MKKFKNCHGAVGQSLATQALPDEFKIHVERLRARQKQRTQQQGLGRPIESSTVGEVRIVVVNDRTMWSNKWRSFEDFLVDYIEEILGLAWGQKELRRPFADRHPLLQCYEKLHTTQSAVSLGNGLVQPSKVTGAAMIYVGLAYYLYLIDHNAAVQKRLLERLRNRVEFQAARFETAVAALFTLSGFTLEFENEQDPGQTHVEFTATHLKSGRKYSVECKSKHRPGIMWFVGTGTTGAPDAKGDVRHMLHNALKKTAAYPRVVFMELNMPDETHGDDMPPWMRAVDASLLDCEQSLTIKGEPAPPAYVFIVNDTATQGLDARDTGGHFFSGGFRIPDFLSGQSMTMREAVEARERHRDMHSLSEHVHAWRTVPSTFDGEIPERALHGKEAPWQIGQRYIVPTKNGEAEGVLEEATMVPQERHMYGVFRTHDGQRVICTAPVDDVELRIYARYPGTYFGVDRYVGGKINGPLDAYDFFYDSYHSTPKEKLLEWMSNWQGFGDLASFSQEFLAKLYCEELGTDMWQNIAKTREGKLTTV